MICLRCPQDVPSETTADARGGVGRRFIFKKINPATCPLPVPDVVYLDSFFSFRGVILLLDCLLAARDGFRIDSFSLVGTRGLGR
jgi:hypothetical protein